MACSVLEDPRKYFMCIVMCSSWRNALSLKLNCPSCYYSWWLFQVLVFLLELEKKCVRTKKINMHISMIISYLCRVNLSSMLRNTSKLCAAVKWNSACPYDVILYRELVINQDWGKSWNFQEYIDSCNPYNSVNKKSLDRAAECWAVPDSPSYSGHYRPERRRKSASGYSFGMRTKTFTHDSTPSPSAYTIPSYVGSGGFCFRFHCPTCLFIINHCFLF